MRLNFHTTCRGFLIVVATVGCALPFIALCATSPSYQLSAGAIDQATPNGLISESYQARINAVTWRQIALGSASYQIVPIGGITPVSSASSASSSTPISSSSSPAVVTPPATNRRPRPEPTPADPLHGAASSAGAPSSFSSASSEGVSAMSSSSSSHAQQEVPQVEEGMQSSQRDIRTFFDATDPAEECEPVTIAPEEASGVVWVLWLLFLIICVLAGAAIGVLRRRKIRWKKHRSIYVILTMIILLCLLGLLLSFTPSHAFAAENTPQAMVYNGQLLNGAGQPVTDAQSIRFSYWNTSDAVLGDTTGTGAINVGAPAYAGWRETHTVTPDARGYFSVELGTITPLPDMTTMPAATLMSLFLQVEIKPAAAPDTAYELLDVDATDTQLDRSSVLSVPFALNADRVDQRHVGTGSGDIITLGSGGILPSAVIPGGTDASTFTLDISGDGTDDSTLQFGSVLQKTLTYSVADQIFRFNDSVDIQGNLTVSGLINGMDLNNILGSSDMLRVSSGGGLNVNVFGGSYRLNGAVVNYAGGSAALQPDTNQAVFFGSGGLTVDTAGFPSDESYIPLAEVLTSLGSVITVTDRRVLQSDDRERSLVQTFTPAYEKVSYEADGNDNVGQLSVGNDSPTLKNFYRWTSTRTNLQDYDIILRVPVSENFVRWSQGNGSHPLTLEYRSTSDDPAENALAVEVFDTAGAPVTLSGATTGLASTTWRTTVLDFGGAPTWTSGQDIVIRIKTSARLNAEMHLGALRLSSVGLTQ